MKVQVSPVIDYSVRLLCTKPYHAHPKGCPNFNHKPGCPPTASYYDQVYDLYRPVFAIINSFDLSAHVQKLKQKYPTWSKRQLECCLYWQHNARRQLFNEVAEFVKENREYKAEFCPEAMGVNITKTLENAGVILEWPPVNFACQVALCGISHKQRSEDI